MKKFALILLIIVLAVLAIWAPWNTVFSKILRFSGLSTNRLSSLSINSKVGECYVYINGEKVGETPYEETVGAGRYDIKLEKITDTSEFYSTFERAIDVEEGTQVIINWELGPSNEFSSGEVMFLKERLDLTKAGSSVSIIPHPDSASIYFDGQIQTESPIIVKDVKDGRHEIKAEKEGYISGEYEVQTEIGYDLFIELRLFPIPINVDESNTVE